MARTRSSPWEVDLGFKVLGQSAPAATTATDLYAVPTGKATVASTLVVCNRGTTAGTYRVAVRPAGAVLANDHYLVYGLSLPAASTDEHTIGLTLSGTDVVTVYASTADFTFSLFGDET